MTIYYTQKAQIDTLQQDKTSTKVLAKQANNANVFSFDLTMELPENIKINEYNIKLKKDKRPFYKPIYNLGPIELEILKTYIKTHLKSRFI